MTKVSWEDKTQKNAAAAAWVYVFIGATVAWFLYTLYRVWQTGHSYAPDFAIQLVLIVLFVKQGFSTYRYRLTEESLVVEERGLFGRKERYFPYIMIDGVCPYTKDILGPLKYRFTHRLSSSMDGRPPMEVVYSVEMGRKMKPARLILKADPSFWAGFAQKLPGLVDIPKEEVVMHAYTRQEAFRQGYTYEEYMAIVEKKKAEAEAAKQEEK